MLKLVNVQRDPELEATIAWLCAKQSRGGPGGVGALRRATRPPSLGHPIYAFRQIDSTMDEAHRLAREGAPEGTLVIALRQEKGRGRLGRTWVSPEGGVYLSLILRPQRPFEETVQLSLVAGLAAAEAIREETGLFPAIRWPNDLLINGKKVAGILAEASKSGTHEQRTTNNERRSVFAQAVILGIGLNVTTPQDQLPVEAISLSAGGAAAVDPWRLVANLCRHFNAWYDRWSGQGFGPVREALRPWIAMFGQPVQLTAGTQQLEGVAQDLDEQGRLVVRLDSGVLRAFEVGEVMLLR